MIPFDQWVKMRARHRVRFWRQLDFANLKRATFTHWIMQRRHWPEDPYLHECLADLREQLPAKRRTKQRKRTK